MRHQQARYVPRFHSSKGSSVTSQVSPFPIGGVHRVPTLSLFLTKARSGCDAITFRGETGAATERGRASEWQARGARGDPHLNWFYRDRLRLWERLIQYYMRLGVMVVIRWRSISLKVVIAFLRKKRINSESSSHHMRNSFIINNSVIFLFANHSI
jgi:hypothetical protein